LRGFLGALQPLFSKRQGDIRRSSRHSRYRRPHTIVARLALSKPPISDAKQLVLIACAPRIGSRSPYIDEHQPDGIPKNLREAKWCHDICRVLWCKPSGVTFRFLWPFPKLSLNRQEEDRHLACNHLAGSPPLLVAVRTNRLIANDIADYPGLFECFSLCSSWRCQPADGPAFGNNPIPPPTGRHEQDPDLSVSTNHKWQGTMLKHKLIANGGHCELSIHSQQAKHTHASRCNPVGGQSEQNVGMLLKCFGWTSIEWQDSYERFDQKRSI
jgi:hypothetical protein